MFYLFENFKKLEKDIEKMKPEVLDVFENFNTRFNDLFKPLFNTNSLIKVVPFPGFLKEELKITKKEHGEKITFAVSAQSTDPITGKALNANTDWTFDSPGVFSSIKYERGNLYFIFTNPEKPVESSEVKID